jgi:hypothetical protein
MWFEIAPEAGGDVKERTHSGNTRGGSSVLWGNAMYVASQMLLIRLPGRQNKMVQFYH